MVCPTIQAQCAPLQSKHSEQYKKDNFKIE